MTHQEERALVAEIARSWIGTNFHHGARIKGVGIDCAQLLAAVFEEAGLVTADLPDYSVDWFMHEGDERYLTHLSPYTEPLADGAPIEVGDIVAFRFGRATSHAGIVVDFDAEQAPVIVHAFRGLGVILDALTPGSALAPRITSVHRLTRWMS